MRDRAQGTRRHEHDAPQRGTFQLAGQSVESAVAEHDPYGWLLVDETRRHGWGIHVG
jgi:hypothetical protein